MSGFVRKPTKEQIAAAGGKRLRDVLGPGLSVLFCGINPGLYSGATGHHFARPGNRFWPALHLSGFTDRLLHPSEDRRLPEYGLGVTNLVERATAAADELGDEELRRGGARLRAKVGEHRPRCVAFLGIGAYTTAFGLRRARVGRVGVGEHGEMEGARVWVLPNPSGLNAHYRLEDFVRLFRQLREAVA